MLGCIKEGDDCFYQILDNVEEAVHVVNCEGVTIFYNRAAAEMDGLNPEEVLGKHVLQVYPSLTIETSSLLNVLAIKQAILNRQQTIVTRVGKTIETHYSTFPLYRNGEIVGACDMCRDITKIKELAERVMELQAELLDSKAPDNKKTKNSFIGCLAKYNFNDIIGSHQSIIDLKVIGQRVAGTTSPILVVGETGVGKELIVQSIHNASNRKNGSFVAQNCAAFPATLLESILFGTVRGSFTGAEDRPGLFELADGGTLFLDEINSMPMELQGKLLRVLQDKMLRRVGDSRIRYVDTRVIACTNIDPEEAVRNKELRVDLYYRLNVVSLKVPPLRSRKSDLPLLVKHFIEMYNTKLGYSVRQISHDALKVFEAYNWPGNIRELQHAIEHAMNMTTGKVIEIEHLPNNLKQMTNKDDFFEMNFLDESIQSNLPEMLRNIEKSVLRQTLEKFSGNISKTAGFLGVPRQTIQYKLKIYGLLSREKCSKNEKEG